MRILVTGAKGQLGLSIQKIAENYPDFDFLFTDVEELDITLPDQLDKYFNQEKPDICINCAGFTAVDKAEGNRDPAYLLNHIAVKNLAEVTMKYSVWLLHISTDYVFSGHSWEPYRELDEPAPTSVYGQSKLAGEMEIIDKKKALIIRTSWLYSEFGQNFFRTMCNLMDNRDELTIVFDQVGTPTYATDLTKAILKISSEIKAGKSFPGIYHFSNEGVASWYDFAYEIRKLKESPCRIIPIETVEYPLPAPRPFYSVLNKSRIKQVYGVDIPHWRESLNTCYKQYTNS